MRTFKPILPHKPGYVEVELNNERYYQNAETGILLRDEETNWQDILQEILDAI